jgi:hypothetical protein
MFSGGILLRRRCGLSMGRMNEEYFHPPVPARVRRRAQDHEDGAGTRRNGTPLLVLWERTPWI